MKPAKKETTEDGGEGANGEAEEEIDMEKLVEERNFIAEESFSGGIAAALKAAREKGMFMDTEAEVSGRRKDKTYQEELSKFTPSGGDRINLEYRDRHGRKMTPKEAFRYQARIFHGIQPSKNKQERERKKFEAAQKLLATAPEQTGSMKAFNALRNQSNQAYVVLDTKNQK